MTTIDAVELGWTSTRHVWFTSVGHPAGLDMMAEDGEELLLPGDGAYSGDGSPWWALTGAVSSDGRKWEWDGVGRPTDHRGNSVTRIVAYMPR